MTPSITRRPPAENSEKYGSVPQPTNILPLPSSWALPIAPAISCCPGWMYCFFRDACMVLVSACRISALDCFSLTVGPFAALSNTVSRPLGCGRTWCCHQNLLRGPIVKFDFLPFSRQTTLLVCLLTL